METYEAVFFRQQNNSSLPLCALKVWQNNNKNFLGAVVLADKQKNPK